MLTAFLLWLSAGGSEMGLWSRLEAQAPQIVFVSPSDGATDVTGDTPIVIQFDRDMDTSVFVLSALGNLSLSPSTLSAQTQGTWSTDKRTLTLKPFFGPWPINVTITWTLNPAGGSGLFPIKSTGGVALASATGSFTTGLGAPTLGSVSPPDGDENVQTNILVTFRFSQPMKPIDLPGGPSPAIQWTGLGLDPARFRYTWSADGRSLGVEYLGGWPLKTRIDWALNPPGASVVFETTTGKLLASDTYRGGFRTTAIPTCTIVATNPTWGSYGINKRSEFRQTSTADPVEETRGDLAPAPHVFSAVVQSPSFGPAFTGGTVQRPNGATTNLTPSVVLSYYEVLPTEADLETAFPTGSYQLRLLQTGLPEWVIDMQLNAGDLPPVPKVLNFAEAQQVDASRDFSLRWTSFANGDGDDLISIFISSADGDVVFQAPNFCIPIPLTPADTSVVIPADTLVPNRNYKAELLFGKSFYGSTNTIPQMTGYGFRLRATRFTVTTVGSMPPELPPTLNNPGLTADGKATFSVHGVAARSYAVQRASQADAGSWTSAGNIQTDGNGGATFVDPEPVGNASRFYRIQTE